MANIFSYPDLGFGVGACGDLLFGFIELMLEGRHQFA